MTPANGERPRAVNPTTEHGRAGLTQERALRTRAQILGAAAHAFATKGFPAVTVLDVAQLAGMTKGAVYFHYPNKEALARAVADEFYQTLNNLTDDVARQNLHPLDAVTQLLTRTAIAFRDDLVIQAGARLQIERSLIATDLPTPYIGYTRTITDWLTQATHTPNNTTPTNSTTPNPHTTTLDPHTTARVLISAFFGAQHISWILTNRTDITQRVQEILTTILPTTPPTT
ncbi:TetR family transcriptional regulator [Kitasatospora herbaricolor]|uniref:ScbR family autoregulator-binding transcription factor n=1 Tax=Kitasatospora herbaricolor TaxID=68217 RepID=UPI001748D466|nr:ScbR family autoregulator-binding transcription factor [Kitasatospora herbaricolor]MDQ0313563.1 AcrR family transcriptional regulator [Kitasatospora herbaricolor]GGV48186.1 TetR family transcriptional regulator [Kitasatospora herbaricolor]